MNPTEPSPAAMLDYPATRRNRDALLEAFVALDVAGDLLEVASGSGQHSAWLAPRLPVRWQPSSCEAVERASIDAWREAIGRPESLRPAIALDVHDTAAWPAGPLDVVFCANMIHIAPWTATLALVRGAARVLAPTGRLVLYGPFAFDGALSPESNVRFDASLRARDPAWGVRDLADVTRVAAEAGLDHTLTRPMPANNHLVVFARRAAPTSFSR
jgi:SAM-dependent methyltransferase